MSLNQFETVTPEGFSLPKAAVKLVNTAALAGWSTGWQWDEDSGGSPFVTVHVADRDTREYFKYTWHSRDTGTLRLRSKLHQAQAGAPWTDGPSVQAAMFRTREVADQRS
ncbi:hypothetical protein ACTFBT_00960 [Streptomyces microflavus]|uniref:Uncharacterized protein n=1 Tax=Streptomyces microflavus TaxID=1919 RepID=A0A7J0D439_STRMI|nr:MULTISPECIES: hypothetical protein [Streptomyces]MDX2978201.1 hypothetical protein [Streptomyces sp. NRRL_B-2249]GFN09503.1 hypothetical protein Smic_80590 [Streptomyces microflavus]GGX67528.1 hypothetical protein GCM10010298_35400 [Streptomyces microflavus]